MGEFNISSVKGLSQDFIKEIEVDNYLYKNNPTYLDAEIERSLRKYRDHMYTNYYFRKIGGSYELLRKDGGLELRRFLH